MRNTEIYNIPEDIIDEIIREQRAKEVDLRVQMLTMQEEELDTEEFYNEYW